MARGINKPPLTPKIASRSSTPQQQNVTVVTPLARRGTRSRPESALSSHNSGAPKDRDDIASPVAAFLSSNITPRSGSRQSRVDSANSTPSSTPNPERHERWEIRSGLGIAESGLENMGRRPTVTFSPPSEAGGPARQDPDSKFFYASDAQKQLQPTAQVRSPVMQPQKTAATFFYANGATVPPRENISPIAFTPAVAAPPPQDNLMSKFVYANGIPDAQPSTKPAFTPSTGPSSVVSTSSKLPSRPSTGVPSMPYSSQRPSSPVKPLYPPAKNGSTPNLHSTRSPMTSPPSLAAQPYPRKQSIDAPSRLATRPGHSRSGSLTSNLAIAEPPAVARILSARNSLPSSEGSSPSGLSPPPFSFPTSNPANSGMASLLQAAEDLVEEDEETKPDSLDSPTKSSTQEKAQENPLNDLVASARRERKVQDLEITNASLEAINRTLERQLRKQTAEIRRYRRLSRSGHLNLTPMGSRNVSTASVEGGALARAGLGLDDLSEEESELEAEEDEYNEDYDFSGSEASEELSPSTMKLRDARHRRRDEQRLQLDLSKHQQLLIDSQKINQSLKRCLGWTEELIKEGKRALEYQVRVSEVDIGGRVLAPEEVEAREAAAAAEDSILVGDETISSLQLEDLDLSPKAQQWRNPAQDRDSGIELPAPDFG
ncbi:hypothetical protein QBC46DRAFT_364435 [Diplogelasinospora grovesii]|uniref:Uncharacterized protein n=1 Tax=Diplogelasinospora grovesii TaxID=303347 RepID=A0AAN6S4T5_9PEZI|nr:hypothetical protein QBC46DRAFT_364435 [Diplogelasinospora grovesii]